LKLKWMESRKTGHSSWHLGLSVLGVTANEYNWNTSTRRTWYQKQDTFTRKIWLHLNLQERLSWKLKISHFHFQQRVCYRYCTTSNWRVKKNLIRCDKRVTIEQKHLEMPAENDVNVECIFCQEFFPIGSKKPRTSV
jgi:hypothetical protein